jgi:hypothetical protein
MFETGGVHDEVRAEAEEIVERRVSGTILNIEYENLRDIVVKSPRCDISMIDFKPFANIWRNNSVLVWYLQVYLLGTITALTRRKRYAQRPFCHKKR